MYLVQDSLHEVKTGVVEDWVRHSPPGSTYQFERIGYFCIDPDSTQNKVREQQVPKTVSVFTVFVFG